MKIAANGELTADFSLKKLCALETADALGRIGKSSDDYLERIEYCSMFAEELGISDSPYKFSTPYTERAYFLGKTNWREGELYKPNDFEVIMMAGLPGTGKDTWIAKNHPDLPVVSLDDIREKYDISPIGPQGEVISIALEKAREYLRKKQPFIWNATSAVYDLRSKISYMFEEYGASVKTVFLETAWDVCLARNNSRDRVVPEDAIRKMLGRFEVPERYESEIVEWITV